MTLCANSDDLIRFGGYNGSDGITGYNCFLKNPGNFISSLNENEIKQLSNCADQKDHKGSVSEIPRSGSRDSIILRYTLDWGRSVVVRQRLMDVLKLIDGPAKGVGDWFPMQDAP